MSAVHVGNRQLEDGQRSNAAVVGDRVEEAAQVSLLDLLPPQSKADVEGLHDLADRRLVGDQDGAVDTAAGQYDQVSSCHQDRPGTRTPMCRSRARPPATDRGEPPEAIPDPSGQHLAGGVVEPFDLVQVVVVEAAQQRLDGAGQFGEILHPADFVRYRTFHVHRDPVRMPMEPTAFVTAGYVGEAVGCLEGELPEDFHQCGPLHPVRRSPPKPQGSYGLPGRTRRGVAGHPSPRPRWSPAVAA